MGGDHGGRDLNRLGEQLNNLAIGSAGQRDEDGYITAIPGKEGHIFYGPYLALPPGRYSVRVIFATDRPVAGASGDPGVVLEVVCREEIIASLPLDEACLEAQVVAFPFNLPAAAEELTVEIRIFTRGECPFVVTSVDVRRLTAAFRHFAKT